MGDGPVAEALVPMLGTLGWPARTATTLARGRGGAALLRRGRGAQPPRRGGRPGHRRRPARRHGVRRRDGLATHAGPAPGVAAGATASARRRWPRCTHRSAWTSGPTSPARSRSRSWPSSSRVRRGRTAEVTSISRAGRGRSIPTRRRARRPAPGAEPTRRVSGGPATRRRRRAMLARSAPAGRATAPSGSAACAGWPSPAPG